MKIVFFGTPEFAVASLSAIVQHPAYEVAAVVTMPDKPAGRGHRMFQSPVKLFALAHDIPVLQPVSLRDPAFLEALQDIAADLFVVIAFRMLPRQVWQMPPRGTFNLHASLLPRYRGAAPINWAVINGDTETGVTTFLLSHDIDTGPLLLQERINICDDDDAGSVHDRLMTMGADLTLRTLDAIAHGTATPLPQDDSEATPAPKIFSDTCRLDFTQPALRLHNLVRGLSPYPGSRATITGADGTPQGDMKILKTRPASQRTLAPGQLAAERGHLYVGCGDGALEILTLQAPGGKRIDAAAYLLGHTVDDIRLL